MVNAAQLQSYLETRLPDALELLRQMVNINSFTLNRDGVNRLARLTADSFAPLGFAAEFVDPANPQYGTHLVLTRRGNGRQSLAMVSHLDTVFPPEEEARNHFHWSVEGDRIFGPGTNDIKGGTVMMWLVLKALQDRAPEVFERITWKLFLNSAEETFSPDFGRICRERLTPHTLAALVFEAEGRLGADRLVVLARKGRATWRVTVKGRGAHAGGKHAHGCNAIVELGRLLPRLAAITDYSRELTVNVATITGGTTLNRVPHEAVAEGELRAFDAATYQAGVQQLLALAGTGEVPSPADGFRCEIQVEILTEARPWPRNAATDRLGEIWVQTGRELGIPVSTHQRGGLSDGNQIWDVVPTLDGLGPWGDGDHCSERSADGSKLPEFVEISGIIPKALLNVMAIVKLAGPH
ncbi:MAG TPA: M20/M25/M40 family metallo-hydrolase [Verrucomicrobiota bacterium]|nr:M20/M25/M40 family metallo-hydrolase [Verrucomicrobiota bacterium]HNT13443.1 M20/M25/M40 family metallo-hydrolase [Verrucomicrobiota bacterium]